MKYTCCRQVDCMMMALTGLLAGLEGEVQCLSGMFFTPMCVLNTAMPVYYGDILSHSEGSKHKNISQGTKQFWRFGRINLQEELPPNGFKNKQVVYCDLSG